MVVALAAAGVAFFAFRGLSKRTSRASEEKFQNEITSDLTRYFGTRFSAPEVEVVPCIKTILAEGKITNEFPGFLRVECAVAQQGPRQCQRTITLLFAPQAGVDASAADPKAEVVELTRTVNWEDLPEFVRNALFDSGKKVAFFLLAQKAD